MEELTQFQIDKFKALPSWTPLEVSALLLEIDPESLDEDHLPESVECLYEALLKDINAGNNILQCFKTEDGIEITPFSAMSWAMIVRKHNIPECFGIRFKRLKQSLSMMEFDDHGEEIAYTTGEKKLPAITYPVWDKPVDMEKLSLGISQIAPPQKTLKKNMVIIDMNSEQLGFELKVAIEAYREIYESGLYLKQKGGDVAKILNWLNENYGKLSKAAKDRIAKVVNLNKKGGAPKT